MAVAHGHAAGFALGNPGRAILAYRNVTLDVINATRYHQCRDQELSDADTEALFHGRRVARFANISVAAMRKLVLLHAATSLDFLRVPPGNRLEVLKGDRAGEHSLRINARWRVCFVWDGSHAHHVEIVDYH